MCTCEEGQHEDRGYALHGFRDALNGWGEPMASGVDQVGWGEVTRGHTCKMDKRVEKREVMG